jgi:hypothetical protein
MRSGFIRLSSAAAFGIIALTLATSAEARGFVSFGIGVPLYYPPPVIYAPPPAYYVPPPPVVYAPPPPAYYAPPAAAPAYYAPPATAPAGQHCREYQSTAVINGQPEQTVGTACLQPDGTWRIVR